MWQRALILILVLSLRSRAAAPPTGPEALRELLRMPTMTLTAGYSINPQDGIVYSDTILEAPEKIARLKKQLDGSLADADRYLQMAECYGDLKDNDDGLNCAKKAIELFRKRIELRPQDGRLMSNFGSALSMVSEEKEAEAALRSAVKLAPKDDECWRRLGTFLSTQSMQMFTFGGRPASDATLKEVAQQRIKNFAKPGADQLETAKKFYDEALQCFDRSVALAPSNAVAYARRGAFKFIQDFTRSTLGAAREPKEDAHLTIASMTLDSSLADFDKAAALNPEDAGFVGQSIFIEFTAKLSKAAKNSGKTAIDCVPEKNARSIREKLAKLEELGKSSNPAIAAPALDMVAQWKVALFNDPRSGVIAARRAVELDPSRESSWQMLMGCLVTSDKADNDELIKVCKAHLERSNNTTNRMYLVRAYYNANQFQNAEEELKTILETAPDDYKANFSYAVLILRRSHKLSEFIAVEAPMRRALEAIKREAKSQAEAREPLTELMLTQAIYNGMTERMEEARQLVDAVIEADKENERARSIRAALN